MEQVGVLASVTTGASREKAEAEIKELCMHIAFTDPAGLSRDDIPAEEVERERAIYLEEVKSKPVEIQARLIIILPPHEPTLSGSTTAGIVPPQLFTGSCVEGKGDKSR